MSDSEYNSYLNEKDEDYKNMKDFKTNIEDDKNLQGPFTIITPKDK